MCESSSSSSGRPAPGRSSKSPRAIASSILRSARYSSAVTAWIITAGELAVVADGDAVGMPGELVPVAPAIDRVAAPLELVDRGARIARLDVQRVARLAEREAPGQPARPGDRLLHAAAIVDHRDVGLQVDLRLPVRAHAAEDGPQPLSFERQRGDERVQRHLARL